MSKILDQVRLEDFQLRAIINAFQAEFMPDATIALSPQLLECNYKITQCLRK